MVSTRELNLGRTKDLNKGNDIMNKIIIPVVLGAMLVSGCQQATMSKSTGGTLIGAGAGGLLGSQFGSGKGKLIGTAIGVLGGAVLGNSVGTTLDKADTHANTPHNPVPVRRPAPTVITYSECLQYKPGSVRSACERGVAKRVNEETQKAEDDAFKKGYKRN
jgi:phage tail tape-measure protein